MKEILIGVAILIATGVLAFFIASWLCGSDGHYTIITPSGTIQAVHISNLGHGAFSYRTSEGETGVVSGTLRIVEGK